MDQTQRHSLAEKARWFCSQNDYIGYDNQRPFAYRTEEQLKQTFGAQELTFKPDCSTAIASLYFVVGGLKDPLGFQFSGNGNTETARAHLDSYTDPSLAHSGALVVFGVGLPLGTQHMAMVVEEGEDPLLYSHGDSRSSILIPFSDENAFHGGATELLAVGRL